VFHPSFNHLDEIPNFLVGPKQPFERPAIDLFSAGELLTGHSRDYSPAELGTSA
jgi:hypothetical protein